MAQVTCRFCKYVGEPVSQGSIDPHQQVSLQFRQCAKCGAVLGGEIASAGIETRLEQLEQELKRLSDELASHRH